MPDTFKIKNNKWILVSPNEINFCDENDIDLMKKKLKRKISFDLKKKSSDILYLTLVPTLDCNLRCIYCYSRGGENKRKMSKRLIKAILDSYSPHYKKIHLRFAGGGEPFMNFNVMEFAVDYAKKKFKEVSIHVITNGTFTEEQYKWIIKNNVFPRISFDSIAQKFQRPYTDSRGSDALVRKNIRKLSKSGKEFAVQTIITSLSINKMIDIIKDLNSLRVKNIKLEPVIISKISRGEKNLMVNPREFVENFLKILKFIKSKNLDMKIDTSLISRPNAGYYCQMPCGNLIITPQGYVTACIEITKKSDPFSELILYGKFDFNKKRFVFNKNNQEKLRKFHFTFYEKCKDCSFKLLCKGGCPMRNLWEGIGAIQKDYTCQMEHLLLPKISQLISKDAAYSDILFQGCKIS